jgi:hypothetical protein
MKGKENSIRFLILAIVMATGIRQAIAQGTAFTYQGQLENNGSPANGSYDLTFTLYVTNSGGTALTDPVTNLATSVTNGLFTAQVDFGPGAFVGGSNWLEIAVSPHGAGSFTTLAPRQQVTPTPYAITAGTANDLAGLTVQQNSQNAPNLIGGSSLNAVKNGVVGATIGGGGVTDLVNYVSGSYGTIGGGAGNTVAGLESTVAGGVDNFASGLSGDTVGGGANNSADGVHGSTVAGGQNNTAGEGYDTTVGGGAGNYAGLSYSTVPGGEFNTASGTYSTVGGGYTNTASGTGSTVPGGEFNIASGMYSFAAGQQAQAVNQGAFVWADSQNTPFASMNNDSFNVRAQGGVNFNTGTNTITGDGGGLTNLNAANLTGAINPSAFNTGTYTPVIGNLNDGLGPGGGDQFTTSVAQGYYQVVGNLVYVEIHLQWTSTANNSIGGEGNFPVTVSLPMGNASNASCFNIGMSSGIPYASQLTAMPLWQGINYSYLVFYSLSASGTGSSSTIPANTCNSSGSVYVSGFYRTQ